MEEDLIRNILIYANLCLIYSINYAELIYDLPSIKEEEKSKATEYVTVLPG